MTSGSSQLATAALVAVLSASAVGALVLGMRPRRRTIAEVRSTLQPSNGLGDPVRSLDRGDRGDRGDHLDRVQALVRPLAEYVARSFGDGLRLVRTEPADVAARVVVGGVAIGFVALCSLGAAMSTGVLPASPWWFAVVALGALAGSVVVWQDTSSRVRRRRREFRRTVTDFVQLVAVGLTTDQSVEEAVQFALDIGDSDLFELLREELATAPLRGVPLWEAIDQLGRTFDQRELCEFAASVERQGTQGVSITDTVNSLAASMRASALDELERDADRANANLSGPTIGFVVATMVFLAYPLAVRVSEAFGGG